MESSNFKMLLRERGKIVPGSRREGHNVFTDTGREWVSNLMAWSTIAPTDIAFEQRRIRWVEVGSGAHPEDHTVSSLQAPITVTTSGGAPATYGVHISSSFPYTFGVRISAEFLEAQVVPAPALIQEAGLVVDDLSITTPFLHAPSVNSLLMAYKTFAPLVKTADFRLEVQWDLRF